MFTEELFTIAKTWKQPKCPSIDDWFKKMWHTRARTHTHTHTHTHTRISLSHEREGNIAICSNMDGSREYHSKWSISDKEKTNIIWYHLYVESKNIIEMNLYTKQKQTHRQKINFWLPKGKWGRVKLGVWD